MNLLKAIEVLTLLLNDDWPGPARDANDALKLGIEALKRIQDMRISPCCTADEILPGETKE